MEELCSVRPFRVVCELKPAEIVSELLCHLSSREETVSLVPGTVPASKQTLWRERLYTLRLHRSRKWRIFYLKIQPPDFFSTIMLRLKFCFSVRARERACSGVRFPCASQRELLRLHILETAGGEGFGNGVTCSVVARGGGGEGEGEIFPVVRLYPSSALLPSPPMCMCTRTGGPGGI